MTVESLGVDHAGPLGGAKRGTTVAMDFGRITIDTDMALYLFGTPVRTALVPLDELVRGAVGAVVLVDTAGSGMLRAVENFEHLGCRSSSPSTSSTESRPTILEDDRGRSPCPPTCP